MSILDKLDLIGLDHLLARREIFKKQCGVYFLFDKDEVVYVGRSVNMKMRVHTHNQRNGHRYKFDSYAFIEMPELSPLEIELMERAYIAKFAPRYNKLGNSRCSEDSD